MHCVADMLIANSFNFCCCNLISFAIYSFFLIFVISFFYFFFFNFSFLNLNFHYLFFFFFTHAFKFRPQHVTYKTQINCHRSTLIVSAGVVIIVVRQAAYDTGNDTSAMTLRLSHAHIKNILSIPIYIRN